MDKCIKKIMNEIVKIEDPFLRFETQKMLLRIKETLENKGV